MKDQQQLQMLSYDWFKNLDAKSEKKMTYTMSEISKQDFLGEYLQSEQWNVDQFNKKQIKKQRNRINAKNSRDRKKFQIQNMAHRIHELEQQNIRLKNAKYCKWCKRPFDNYLNNYQNTEIQSNAEEIQKKIFQFQKPEFHRNQKKGKLWVAIGLLMLIIGLAIYGIGGTTIFKEIEVAKEDSVRWARQFFNKPQQQYFNVKFKAREQSRKGKEQREPGIEEILENVKIKFRDKEEFVHEKELLPNVETEVDIHRQLLYAIHAQIDDIGWYI